MMCAVTTNNHMIMSPAAAADLIHCLLKAASRLRVNVSVIHFETAIDHIRLFIFEHFGLHGGHMATIERE